MFLKAFITLGLIIFGFILGRAFVTGSVQLRGEKEPLRLQDNPKKFKETMAILTVIYVLLVAVITWIFVLPLFFHSR
jgi:succinate dehydrogenase/fumarate reductase cytochrome b subunit